MNAQTTAALLASSFLLSACAERTALLHTAASLTESSGQVRVSDGQGAVLEFKKVSGIPIPDAFSGIGLFVELDPRRLVQGAVLEVPADVVRCIAWRLNAPWQKSAEDCAGSLVLRSVSSEIVLASLDVRSASLDLVVHRRLKYAKTSQQRTKGPARRPNNAVNASVRPVTPLAASASVAPVRPARYRGRWADMKAKTESPRTWLANRVLLSVLLSSIVAVAYAASPNPAAQIRIEIWRTGDDALTMRFGEDLDAALRKDPAFFVWGGEPPTLNTVFVRILENLHWKPTKDGNEVTYKLSFTHFPNTPLGQSEGSCKESELSNCVSQAVEQTKRAAGVTR